MNNNLLNIVKRITAQYGESILGDSARLKPFFSDLAKDEPKPLRMAFGRCVEAGAYHALKTASNAADRIAHKTAIAERVRDEHGIDPLLCGEALDILEAVLFGTASSAQQPQYQQPQYQPPQPQPPQQPQYQQPAPLPPQQPVLNPAPPQHADEKSAWGHFCAAMKKYTVFEGRARRKEYWYFTLFFYIFYFAAEIIDFATGLYPILTMLPCLVLFLPSLGVTIRRLHDVGKSGWWLFVPIYNIVLFCTAGDTGTNKYGNDPKQGSNP